jgi:hypothetical protein
VKVSVAARNEKFQATDGRVIGEGAGVSSSARRNGFATTKKELDMKTIVTLTIVALFAATAARAEVITKGGASALLKAPVVKTEAAPPAMKCAMCKSEFVTIKASSFKGTTPTSVLVERHACTSCGNKWVTSGHGKAKVELAVHTCGGCTI